MFVRAWMARVGSGTVGVGTILTIALSAAPARAQGPVTARAFIAVDDTADKVWIADTADRSVNPIDVSGDPATVAFSPDGRKAYVTHQSTNSVSVIDVATSSLTGLTATVGTSPRGIAVSADGSTLYVANYHAGSISFLNAETLAAVRPPLSATVFPGSIAVAGTRVYVTHMGAGRITEINGTNNTLTRSISAVLSPGPIAAQAGQKVFVAELSDNTIKGIDPLTGSIDASIPLSATPRAMAISPDGRLLYTANHDANSVSIVELNSSPKSTS